MKTNKHSNNTRHTHSHTRRTRTNDKQNMNHMHPQCDRPFLFSVLLLQFSIHFLKCPLIKRKSNLAQRFKKKTKNCRKSKWHMHTIQRQNNNRTILMLFVHVSNFITKTKTECFFFFKSIKMDIFLS